MKPRRRIGLRALSATGALLLVLLSGAVIAFVHGSAPTLPAFYTWSHPLPHRPGVLLREQVVTHGIPPDVLAVRILYTTTRTGGAIAPTSGLVLVSRTPPAGPRPGLLWDHGTTGVAQNCAPSLLGNLAAETAPPALHQILARGWALVAPDYIGLGAAPPHPYLVGVPEARSGLDAVRAVRQLRTIRLTDKTVVWGHSQGGGAALWTGIESASYAPDVRVSAVAALAPASDLVALARNLEAAPSGKLFATYLVDGYSHAYSNVATRAYIRPAAETVVRRIVDQCVNEPVMGLALLAGNQIFARPLTSGPLGARLTQNIPDEPTGIPMLVAQGLDDAIVLPSIQQKYAKRMCKAGQKLEYLAYPGRDHSGLVSATSPLIPYLLSWTAARFRGAPAPDDCSTLTRG